MKYILLFAFFSSIYSNENFCYQAQVYKRLDNGYFSCKSFNIPSVHVEGIITILLSNNQSTNQMYFVNLTRQTLNPEEQLVVCTAELTLNSLHKLAQYIPALMVVYK